MKHYQKYLVEAECERCHKSFQAYKYNVLRGWGKYCSQSCNRKGNTDRRGAVLSDETKQKVSESLKVKFASGELVSPLRTLGLIGLRGEKAMNWQGGKTLIGQKFRNTIQYKEWRLEIFKRDDYTCQMCGVRGGKIQADHIKPFSQFPELRLNLENGRTLCIPCHRATDTWGAHKKETTV